MPAAVFVLFILNVQEFYRMSIWKEISETMLKFGEIVLNKTEIVTQMAKCRIAIKNKETEIDKVRIEIGNYTIIQIEQKEPINEEIVRFKIEKINAIRKEIEELTVKYNTAKSQLISEKKQDAGSDTGGDKQAD